MFELGTTAKDVITGFEGIVTGHVRYMTGCDQYLLQVKMTEKGKKPVPEWFDETRLVAVNKKKVTLPKQKLKANPGPDRPAPSK